MKTFLNFLLQEGVSNDELYETSLEKFLAKIKTEKVQTERIDERKPEFSRRRRGLNLEQILKTEESKDSPSLVDQKLEMDPKYKPIRLRLDKVFEDMKDETKESK